MTEDRKVSKVHKLLEAHKAAVIEQLGPAAFDILTPYEAAGVADVRTEKLPELIRQGWMEPVPYKDIGRAHQYYRWRAVFVKQYKRTYQTKKKKPV